MEAVVAITAARSRLCRGVASSPLREVKSVTPDLQLTTNFRGLIFDGGSSNHGYRCLRLCHAVPRATQNQASNRKDMAVRGALKKSRTESDMKPEGELEPKSSASRRGSKAGLPGFVARTIGNALFGFLQYAPLEEKNIWTTDNFGPVDEIGDKVSVELISGAIPLDFPAGTYVRTGANPLFGGKSLKSRLGVTRHHWFEGDGMLHAIYIHKCGNSKEFKLFYKNKYVETEGYLVEKEAGKPVVLNISECSPSTLLANIFLNKLRFGFLTRPTCNTSVWCHNGRVFASAEGSLPYEIDISDLSTIGPFDFKGAWPVDNFTAHPKIDPVTNELICQGVSSTKRPYTQVGVVAAADGETLVHLVGVDTLRLALNHEILITERYSVVMDIPLSMEPENLSKGKPLIHFDSESVTRFGILPRFGQADSVRWFPVETCFMFHSFNAYEDGNEVVLHGLPSKASFLNVDMSWDKAELYRRGITPRVPDQEGYDPLVDGALMTHLHEWRFNLETGTVTERDIYDEENYFMMELPRINEAYVGRKYRYGYAPCHDLDKSREKGLPYFNRISKIDFSSVESKKGVVKSEFHELGPNRYGNEALFVAKPGSTAEDDGWILMYVHDESTNQSEAIIVDAQRFSAEPVARIRSPQRVPFGFHGTYVHSG